MSLPPSAWISIQGVNQLVKFWRALCAVPFYLRDLNICRFWYFRGSWNQSATDTEGYIYTYIYIYIHTHYIICIHKQMWYSWKCEAPLMYGFFNFTKCVLWYYMICSCLSPQMPGFGWEGLTVKLCVDFWLYRVDTPNLYIVEGSTVYPLQKISGSQLHTLFWPLVFLTYYVF